MRVIMYNLVPRLPSGEGRRTKFAEQYWSGVPLDKICGRRYMELVATDADVFEVDTTASLVAVLKWAATTEYDAVYFDNQLLPVVAPDTDDIRKRELLRIISLFNQGNLNWVHPNPKEQK